MSCFTGEPFYGLVETTEDALRLIQAARYGIIPRTTRRLNESEKRSMITSGAVFVFSEKESGIKRWTEGLSWSASRIVGNFLVYRELSYEAAGGSPVRGQRSVNRRYTPTQPLLEKFDGEDLLKSSVDCFDDNRLCYKAHGLFKKTITVSVNGSDYHLIAYYSQDDVRLGRLLPLVSRPDILSLEIPPDLLESTKFRVPPLMCNGSNRTPTYTSDLDAREKYEACVSSAPDFTMSQALVFQQVMPWDAFLNEDSPVSSSYLNFNLEPPGMKSACSVSSFPQYFDHQIHLEGSQSQPIIGTFCNLANNFVTS